MLSVAHIVARATYVPDTVRCERDVPFHVPSYESPGYFEFSLLMQCYVDIRVNSYILGNGPPNLTIQVFHYHYRGNTHGQADFTHDESIDRILWGNEMILETGDPLLPPEVATTGLYGREEILFLGPSMNHATEALQKFDSWDVQTKADGTVIAVHPARDHWTRRYPNDFQTHQASLEMELPAFAQAIATAHQERVADYGGRILSANYDGKPEGVTFPMLITDANRLSQFYRDTGAYDHPGGPPTPPTPVPSCARGGAVANTAANRPLRRDCTALLDAKDTLAGTATLNWSKDLSMASWTGVTVSGTPERITAVNMASSSLSGTIPEGIAKLDALTSLDLSSNSLTGDIPESLENLKALTTLKLSGNSLTGCIPPALRDIATHDLDDLELPDCQPPTEAASCAGSTAVGTDPAQELVDDCNVLLDAKATLAGTGTLNWSKNLGMTDWDGITLSAGRVHRIILTDKGLDGVIPATLGDLTELTRIDLDENSLTGEIPAQLGNLKRMTHLYLFENSLTGAIPPELGSMTALQILYISDNSLTGTIPTELGDLSNLTQLILGDNDLTGPIPDEIAGITTLRHLFVRDNRLTGQIPRSLSTIPFTHLSLSGNAFTGCLPTGMETVIPDAHDLWRAELAALPSCGPSFGEASAFSVARTSAAGDAVGTTPATPWDTGGTVAYAITAGNEGGLFQMDQATGAITLARAPAATDTDAHTLTVQGTDGHGQETTVTVAITLTK